MKLHPDSDAIQRSGRAILVNLQSCTHSIEADLMGRSAAVAAMTKHPTDVRIQFLGRKVLIATPPPKLSHVTLFGGPGALARAMRVCGTNQDFQIAACRQLGAFYACQVAARYGDRERLGARHQRNVQRQGLGTDAVLSALEAARVQEAGLSELREWAFSGGPAQQTYEESKPGAKPPVPDGYMKRADYTWAFGGVPQFPCSPLSIDWISGLGYSVDLPKNHLLLTRALEAAGSAMENFPSNSKCTSAALSAMAELLNMSSSEFDIAGFAQKLRRIASGEESAGEHGLEIRTTLYKAGAKLGLDLVADRAPSQPEPVSGQSDLHEEALSMALRRMALAFSSVIGSFQEVVLSTGDHELRATILSNLLDYAKLPQAFCMAYRMRGILIWRRKYEGLLSGEGNLSYVVDGDGGQNEENSSEGVSLSGAALRGSGVPANGEGHTEKPEEKVFKPPTVSGILAGPAKRAGVARVVELALRTLTLVLPWTDASREAALELVRGLRSLYDVYSELDGQGGGEQGRDPHARETKPYGADWKASGLRALLVSLLAHDKAFVLAGRAGPEFESLESIMRSFARALDAAVAIPAVRAGGAAGLCREPPLLEELIGILHRHFMRPDCGRRKDPKGGRLAVPLPPYEEELHKAVSWLFTECPEVSVYAARVGAPLLLQTFLRTWGRKEPVSSDALTITQREMCTRFTVSELSFCQTNHPSYRGHIGKEVRSCNMSSQF
jgi:hypothetical protein